MTVWAEPVTCHVTQLRSELSPMGSGGFKQGPCDLDTCLPADRASATQQFLLKAIQFSDQLSRGRAQFLVQSPWGSPPTQLGFPQTLVHS